jgi:predicted DNA-binding transcriptional regulator AlpA
MVPGRDVTGGADMLVVKESAGVKARRAAVAELGPAVDRLIDVQAVAGLLSLSARSVWKLHAAGKLPSAMRVGRAVRWKLSDVQSFIADGGTVGGKQ